MENAKHTPGPWKQDAAGYIRGANGEPIYCLNADARLIVAAPDLLEALTEIYKLWMCPEPKRMKDYAGRCDVMADYARKAIAKAEGRE